MFQLDGEHGTLQTFHAEVVPREAVLILSDGPMVAQHTNVLGHARVAGHDSSALPEAAEVLTRVEAEAARNSQCPGHLSLVGGAVCLASVFDQPDVMPIRNL